MKPGLQLRQSQTLSLTPQLQQAIRLLQLSQIELQTELRELAEANPLIDLDEMADAASDDGESDERTASESAEGTPDGEASADAGEDSEYWNEHSPQVVEWARANRGFDDDETPEQQDAAPEGLREHLLWQANLSGFSPREQAIATAIIDALDDDGYLREGMEPVLAALHAVEPAVARDEAEGVRLRVQHFDPTGVASLDLGDCLAVQLEQLDPATDGRELAREIVAGGLDFLAKREFGKLARKLNVREDDVVGAATLIRALDPRPGSAFDPTPPEYVAPDAYAIKSGGRWRVSLSPDCQPRLAINQHYCSLIARAQRSDATWMRGQLQEARWLIKSLAARADTLFKVAQAIVNTQSAFLDFGPEAMRPLVMRELAEELGMHESTISRVTTRKYLHTPRGTFEFKHFFSSSVATEDGGTASATAIQAMIRKLVDEEDPRKPLSDQTLTTELNQRGIRVARRTVAKYREQMRIPSSGERLRAQ
ncbi:MAG TPA: RNA polymerase factor sigma-54 [Rhodanobacteraceae bacterium]|jgi:RNA polymerase sigma-54 factor|nr:RNA polymerase factor sigma-54 [Rhodanobacteraceae bacterium]